MRLYALGTIQWAVADFGGVSQASVSRIVKRVSGAIAAKAPQFINMPSTEKELLDACRAFYAKARFPKTIGAIDCTHIRIQSPGAEEAERFRNRKNWFSINVQTISAADLKIISLVCRWPGATHDHIFKNSAIRQRFECGDFRSFILVGDSGYMNTMYMATPFLDTAFDPVLELYNESQIRTRNCVERSYGVLKRRFPILSLGMKNRKLQTVQEIIAACCVLHNIAIDERDALPPAFVEGFGDMLAAAQITPAATETAAARRLERERAKNSKARKGSACVRDLFVANYFAQLLANAEVNELGEIQQQQHEQ